jgi:hypothetical protein
MPSADKTSTSYRRGRKDALAKRPKANPFTAGSLFHANYEAGYSSVSFAHSSGTRVWV